MVFTARLISQQTGTHLVVSFCLPYRRSVCTIIYTAAIFLPAADLHTVVFSKSHVFFPQKAISPESAMFYVSVQSKMRQHCHIDSTSPFQNVNSAYQKCHLPEWALQPQKALIGAFASGTNSFRITLSVSKQTINKMIKEQALLSP